VDGSAFSRALTKNGLELAGHRVAEAATAKDAAARLEKEPFEVVVVSADGTGDRAKTLLRQVGPKAKAAGARVVAIATRASFAGSEDCDARVLRSDRDGLLRAVLAIPDAPAVVAAEPSDRARRGVQRWVPPSRPGPPPRRPTGSLPRSRWTACCSASKSCACRKCCATRR
jgi:hypothetical protein